MKCDACGAPVENGKCTYCGKEFPEDIDQPIEKEDQPKKVVINVIAQEIPEEENTEKKGCWRTFGIILLWIYFFPIMLSYYFWKKSNLPQNQKILILVIAWILIFLITGICSCISGGEEEASSVSTTNLSDSAETVYFKLSDGTIMGKISVTHANKADVTEDALQEWYTNIVSPDNHIYCVIVYDDEPSLGVYATKKAVQKDVELVLDNDIYELGSDRGSTFYSVDDNGQLKMKFSEPTKEEADRIITQIDNFIDSSYKGDGYSVEVGGDKQKLDVNITLVNPDMDNSTYQDVTAYLAGKIKEADLPVGYMDISYRSNEFIELALGSVDDVSSYSDASSISVKIF